MAAEAGGLALVLAGGCGLLGIDHHFADGVDDFHCFSYGHSLSVVDFNNDGNLDIFCAEMRLDGGNPEAKIYLLFGDGDGNFKTTIVDRGFDLHESRIADLDGNGTLDILGKPYNWDTPRLDVWLNGAGDRWQVTGDREQQENTKAGQGGEHGTHRIAQGSGGVAESDGPYGDDLRTCSKAPVE